MKLIVTGGLGFIGSAFVRLFHDKYDIHIVDAMTYAADITNLDGLIIPLTICDIGDMVRMNDLFYSFDPDVVVNFAAESVGEDEIVAIHDGFWIKHMTFKQLWESQLSDRAVNIVATNPLTETIDITNNTFKCIGYSHGMGHFFRIKQISRHRYRGPIVRLSQSWGEVSVTPNHSVYAADGNLVSAESNPALLAMRKLNWYPKNVLDTVELTYPQFMWDENWIWYWRRPNIKMRKRLSGESLCAFVQFMAAFISEGCCSFNKANGSYLVSISNKNKDWLENLIECAKLFINVKWSISRCKNDVWQLAASSKVLFDVCHDLMGDCSAHRKFPYWVYHLSDSLTALFLEHLVFGDGFHVHLKRDYNIGYTTTSKILAAQLGLLLTVKNLDYSLYSNTRSQSDLWNRSYTLRQVRHYQINQSEQRVNITDYDGWVYDLTVEEVHNFAVGIGNVIVHNTHVDRSITDDTIFCKSNVLGVLNLLHLCRKYKTKRFHQVSTDEIYGQLLPGDPAWTEESPVNPRNLYSASKTAAEHLVMAYYHTHGLDGVITRGANTYGAHQFPEKLLPVAFKRLSEGKPIPVYGQGLQMRDWLYVDDHARAIERVMLRGKPGNAYNIPGTQEMRNIDMVQHLIKAWGADPETSIEFVGDRLGHDFRYHMDGSKLRRLGWLHDTQFERGIEKTVAWYREFLGR